jgi:hypothetical protein
MTHRSETIKTASAHGISGEYNQTGNVSVSALAQLNKALWGDLALVLIGITVTVSALLYVLMSVTITFSFLIATIVSLVVVIIVE